MEKTNKRNAIPVHDIDGSTVNASVIKCTNKKKNLSRFRTEWKQHICYSWTRILLATLHFTTHSVRDGLEVRGLKIETAKAIIGMEWQVPTIHYKA